MNPLSYGLIPRPSRSVVRSPTRPIVKMNARASGTPAKLDATPEKVISPPRKRRGPPEITAYAIRNPKMPPARAVTRLISMLVR